MKTLVYTSSGKTPKKAKGILRSINVSFLRRLLLNIQLLLCHFKQKKGQSIYLVYPYKGEYKFILDKDKKEEEEEIDDHSVYYNLGTLAAQAVTQSFSSPTISFNISTASSPTPPVEEEPTKLRIDGYLKRIVHCETMQEIGEVLVEVFNDGQESVDPFSRVVNSALLNKFVSSAQQQTGNKTMNQAINQALQSSSLVSGSAFGRAIIGPSIGITQIKRP
jgi:hypothetical protein